MEFLSAQKLKSGNSRSLILSVLMFGPAALKHGIRNLESGIWNPETESWNHGNGKRKTEFVTKSFKR